MIFMENIGLSKMTKYENFHIAGDFHPELSEYAMGTSCQMHILHNLVKSPTCFKYPKKILSVMDLILTNYLKLFMSTQTVATGLPGLYELTLSGSNMHYEKASPKIVTYRGYKNFSNESFRSDVINEIGRYRRFLAVLNKYVPIKKDTLGLIKKSSWTKNLIKLLWLDLKLKAEENRLVYNRQSNFCIKLLL